MYITISNTFGTHQKYYWSGPSLFLFNNLHYLLIFATSKYGPPRAFRLLGWVPISSPWYRRSVLSVVLLVVSTPFHKWYCSDISIFFCITISSPLERLAIPMHELFVFGGRNVCRTYLVTRWAVRFLSAICGLKVHVKLRLTLIGGVPVSKRVGIFSFIVVFCNILTRSIYIDWLYTSRRSGSCLDSSSFFDRPAAALISDLAIIHKSIQNEGSRGEITPAWESPNFTRMRDDITRGGIIPPCFEDEETAGSISTSNGGNFLTCLLDLTPVKAPRPPAVDSADSLQQQMVAISSPPVSSSRDVLMLLGPIRLGSAAHDDMQQDMAIEEVVEVPLTTVPDTPRYLAC